jgi:hypothetical protein
MNIKKTLIIIFSVVVVIGGCVVFAQNEKSIALSDDVIQVSASGSLEEVFSNLTELEQRASAIVEVRILKSESIVYKDLPFTISTATVLSKVKGDLKEGQEIKLIETGGKYKLTGENPKEKAGQEVDWRFDGISVMQPEEHLFLFIENFEGPQIEGAYIPLGVYQGKFLEEKDGKFYQQAPEDIRLKDYKPVSKEEFMLSLSLF